MLSLFASCKEKNENENNGIADSTTTVKSSTSKNETPKNIHIMAKPDSVVVDMTNDFGSKGGIFDRAGINIIGIQEVVVLTAKVLAAASQAYLSDLGESGVYCRTHSIHFMHAGDTITAPDGSRSHVEIRDNRGTDIVPDLKTYNNDRVIIKTH